MDERFRETSAKLISDLVNGELVERNKMLELIDREDRLNAYKYFNRRDFYRFVLLMNTQGVFIGFVILIFILNLTGNWKPIVI